MAWRNDGHDILWCFWSKSSMDGGYYVPPTVLSNLLGPQYGFNCPIKPGVWRKVDSVDSIHECSRTDLDHYEPFCEAASLKQMRPYNSTAWKEEIFGPVLAIRCPKMAKDSTENRVLCWPTDANPVVFKVEHWEEWNIADSVWLPNLPGLLALKKRWKLHRLANQPSKLTLPCAAC